MSVTKSPTHSLEIHASPNDNDSQRTLDDSEANNKHLIDLISHEDVKQVHSFFDTHPDYGDTAAANRSCLHLAIEKNKPDIVELLLKNKFKVGTSLFTAVRVGSKECVEIVLPYIDDDAPPVIPKGTFLSPLMLAIQMEDYDIIELLVKNGNRVRDLGTEDYKDDDRDLLSSLKLIHYYCAVASPLYIAYTYLNSKEDLHPMYQIFKLNDKLIDQGVIDFEFKKNYQELSKELEKFAVDLLEQCRTLDEIKVLTNVNDELQNDQNKENLKYINVRSERKEPNELTVMNLAIRSGNVQVST